MSNTSWVTTRKHLTIDRLIEDTKDILAVRNLDMEVVKNPKFNEVVIEVKLPHDMRKFRFWLMNKNRIEFSHGESRGVHYLEWLFSIIQNDLCVKYSGWIRDEGLGPEETIPAYPNKHPTFASYVDMRLSHIKCPDTKNKLVDFFYEDAPTSR